MCFGFLDTSVIAYWLYGSNSQRREAIKALTVRVHVVLLTSSSLLKEKKLEVIGEKAMKSVK